MTAAETAGTYKAQGRSLTVHRDTYILVTLPTIIWFGLCCIRKSPYPIIFSFLGRLSLISVLDPTYQSEDTDAFP